MKKHILMFVLLFVPISFGQLGCSPTPVINPKPDLCLERGHAVNNWYRNSWEEAKVEDSADMTALIEIKYQSKFGTCLRCGKFIRTVIPIGTTKTNVIYEKK